MQPFLIYYLSPQEEISIIDKEPSTPNKLQPITKHKSQLKQNQNLTSESVNSPQLSLLNLQIMVNNSLKRIVIILK